MTTRFYRVIDDEGHSNSPVAWADRKLFVWVPNTGEWHRNGPLEIDFTFDGEFTYVELTPEQAVEQMHSARPADERVVGWLMDRYRAQSPEDRRSSTDFGLTSPEDTAMPRDSA